MSAVEAQGAVRVCATCGQAMTHVGPDGECMRCLVSFGFLSDEQQSEEAKSSKEVRPGPLRYAHFEMEVNADGYPKILGSGAMAVTYCARDTILNSTVALKVIGRKLAADPTARARFLREARAAAQIQHPNVARVIHYGEQDGECFYAMELVHGETLEERVQRDGPLPLSLALEVVEQAARGLAAGEACGVIHRDLKPSNLMTESDASGQMLVKIIDYGVAKVMVSDPTLQTQAGFIGTPAFASPEQFNDLGQQQIDTRSDIYSLGVVFWYLLTGRTPCPGQSLQEMRAKQSGELPLEQLKAAHVPAQVLGLLRSMLAVDPKKRPQSARELLTVVHRSFVRFEPGALLRRKQFFIGFAALGLVIAVVSLAIFGYQRAQSSSQLDRAIAVLPFESLSSHADDQFFAIGIQDEILTKLASLADLKVIARTSTKGYESKPVDLKVVGRQLGVGRVLEGSLQRSADKVRVNVQLIDTRTNAHLWANSYDRKLDDIFAVQTEIANAIAQQLDAKLVQRISTKPPTANTAAYNAYLRGVGIEHSQSSGGLSNEDSATAYAEAVRLDPNFALGWARLSIVRSFLYYHGVDPNVNSAAAVKEAADRALALAPELGEAWLAQGTYRSRVLNDPAAALQAYREAENRLPNSALVREYMAYAERRLDRWREAELISSEQSSSTHATLGFGPISRTTYYGRWGERQRHTRHTIEPWISHPTMNSLPRSRLRNINRRVDSMKPPKSLPVYQRILPIKRCLYIAWIRRSWNVTSTKQSFGLKRQQALPVQDKRTIPKTSLLSCFRATANSGPVIMRTHAPPSSVSSTKSRLGVFSARRRSSHRDFILPSRMPGSATNRMRTSRRGEALPIR